MPNIDAIFDGVKPCSVRPSHVWVEDYMNVFDGDTYDCSEYCMWCGMQVCVDVRNGHVISNVYEIPDGEYRTAIVAKILLRSGETCAIELGRLQPSKRLRWWHSLLKGHGEAYRTDEIKAYRIDLKRAWTRRRVPPFVIGNKDGCQFASGFWGDDRE